MNRNALILVLTFGFILLVDYPGAAETVTWQGPASGGAWSEGANWGGTAPTAADVAVFPDGTTDVTLDAATEVSGLTLNGALTLNGTAALTVGADGITAAAQENTIKTPVVLNGSQTWNVAASGNLIVEGVISGGASTETLTKGTGTGSLTLKGINTFESKFNLAKGSLYLWDNATIGADRASTDAMAESGVFAVHQENKAMLYLHNATVNRPIALSGGTAAVDSGDNGQIRAMANTTNTLACLVRALSASGTPTVTYYTEAESQLIISGGANVKSGQKRNVRFGGEGEIVVRNTALGYGSSLLYCLGAGNGVTVRFQKSGNAVGELYLNKSATISRVHLEVDNVFSSKPNVVAYSASSSKKVYLYLHGTSQTLGNLNGRSGTYAYIHSDEPGAKVTVNQAKDMTDYFRYSGNVSVYKTGNYSLDLSQTDTMTATGTLGVSAGTLNLASGVIFSNVTNIEVTSSGTFKTNKAGAFSRTCDVTLDGASATLNLNFTGTNECCHLYMRNANDVLKPVKVGVYGATGSGAPNELANIVGTGFLKVRKSGQGFIILFK